MSDAVTDLVPSVSVDNLLQQRDAMAERAREAHRLLVEVGELHRAALEDHGHHYWDSELALAPHHRKGNVHGDFTDADGRGLEGYLRRIDASFWRLLFSESGLRSFMSADALRKWDEAVEKLEVPPLTRENVEATFRTMHAARGQMFEEGVVAVFRGLSWDYKTNNPVKFGKRIIMRYICDPGRWTYVRSDSSARLDDLLRVMHVLDGKPEPDHRRSAYRRLTEAWEKDRRAVADLGYFTVRGFQNGNAHLTFTRPDLVDKMNLIVARHFPGALPPARDAERAA